VGVVEASPMMARLWAWLVRPWPLAVGWHEFQRYGSHPWDLRYTFAYWDGEGGWWQYQDGGPLWQRFDAEGWTLVRGR
jgi:hypothetical protein